MRTTEHKRGVSMWILTLAVPVVAAVTIAVTLSATSNDPVSAVGAGAGGGGVPTDGTSVTIENFAYSPPNLRVAAGETVTVTNADGAAHTLTARDGTFDTGDLGGGARAEITIDAPGRYQYFCDIHNYMTGTIEAT